LLSSRREKSKDGGRRRGCAGCEAGAGGAVQGPHDVVRRHDVPASAAPSSDTTSAAQVITHPPLPLHAHRLRSFPLAWLKLSGRLLLLRVVPPPRANLQRRSFLGRPGYGARCLSRSGHSFASTFSSARDAVWNPASYKREISMERHVLCFSSTAAAHDWGMITH
jgi:hypothetical protein